MSCDQAAPAKGHDGLWGRALFPIIPAFELVVVGSDSAAAVVSRSAPSSACLHLRKSLV